MKSADELYQEYLDSPGTTRGESMKEFAAIIAARDEEMRQEWVKENRAWCAARNMPIDTCLVGRMLSVGKSLLKKGQLVYQDGHVYQVIDPADWGAYADNGRPLKLSDLLGGNHLPIGGDGPVFLKEAME